MEENLSLSITNYDIIIQVLKDKNISYTENKEKLIIIADTDTKDFPIKLEIIFDVKRSIVKLQHTLDFTVDIGASGVFARAFAKINKKVAYAKFDYDILTGQVTCVNRVMFKGATFDKAMYSLLIYAITENTKCYYSNLKKLLLGQIDLDQVTNV